MAPANRLFVPPDSRRYRWSSSIMIFAALCSALVADASKGYPADLMDASLGLARRGRQLAAFEVEALGGPVSQNCSSAPWRVCFSAHLLKTGAACLRRLDAAE
jgi:hypothetical protein